MLWTKCCIPLIDLLDTISLRSAKGFDSPLASATRKFSLYSFASGIIERADRSARRSNHCLTSLLLLRLVGGQILQKSHDRIKRLLCCTYFQDFILIPTGKNKNQGRCNTNLTNLGQYSNCILIAEKKWHTEFWIHIYRMQNKNSVQLSPLHLFE